MSPKNNKLAGITAVLSFTNSEGENNLDTHSKNKTGTTIYNSQNPAVWLTANSRLLERLVAHRLISAKPRPLDQPKSVNQLVLFLTIHNSSASFCAKETQPVNRHTFSLQLILRSFHSFMKLVSSRKHGFTSHQHTCAGGCCFQIKAMVCSFVTGDCAGEGHLG